MMMTVIEDLNDRRDLLLLEYACGALDEALSLLVASWLTLSPEARALVARYETLGGQLMCQSCSPVRMEEGSLRNVLDRLDGRPVSTPAYQNAVFQSSIPRPLQSYMEACATGWRRLEEGVRALELSIACTGKAAVIALDPGMTVRRDVCEGYETTLVLSGSYSDGRSLYRSGQLIISNANLERRYDADRVLGCMALTITDHPSAKISGLRGFVQKLLGR